MQILTNEEIWDIARNQSAADLSCQAEDFLLIENKIVISKKNEMARKYLRLPFFCNLVSYGNNIVASVDETIAPFVWDYINRYETAHCFETPNLYVLLKEFEKHEMAPCFMAEYFLPDVSRLKELPCAYQMKVMQQEDFSELYKDEWSNALCERRKQLDILGVGAFDGERLIGLAGCSADCGRMWQIGVDVLPEYRRQKIAEALTSKLALLILELGKVPFYCAAWSNMPSVRNAIKCGFEPAWVELISQPKERISEIINQ